MTLTISLQILLAAAAIVATWALARMAARRPLTAFLLLQCWYVLIQFLLESVFSDTPLATASKEVLTGVFILGAFQQWLAYPRTGVLRIRGFAFVAMGSIGCAIVAALTSPEGTRAVAALRFFALYPILMFAAIAMRHEVAADPRSLVRFLRQFLILGVAVSVFGLLSYQFHGLIDSRWLTSAAAMNEVTQRSGIASNAVVSTLGNRSNMGGFAVLMLLMAAGTRHVIFRKRWAWVGFLGCGPVALALTLTFSRTAYVGLAVGGLFLFLAERRPNLKILVTATILIAGVGALVDAVAPDSIAAALDTITDSTLSGRSGVWNDIAARIPESPFGVGLGVYGKGLRGFGADLQLEGMGAVDNSFLLITVEQGLQAAALWMLLFLAIGIRAFKNLRSVQTPLGTAVARMVWAWYWAFLAMGVTIDWFHALPIICPLWFFFGFQFALPALERAWVTRHGIAYKKDFATASAGGATRRGGMLLPVRQS
ncbi:MAG TPA: O-antigen ligase family protein [Candidatus Acidoferrum sp.]|jgi:O-antigen ligase|nr:O-antigen ligase family protein [Candidatus Acidoferrum sp.]